VKVKGDRYEGWVHGGYLTNGQTPKAKEVVSIAPPKSKKKKRGISDSAITKILIARDLAYYPGNYGAIVAP